MPKIRAYDPELDDEPKTRRRKRWLKRRRQPKCQFVVIHPTGKSEDFKAGFPDGLPETSGPELQDLRDLREKE